MKKILIIGLFVLNLVAILVLGLVYFFRFDLRWGISKEAITLGLPLLIAFLVTLACMVLNIKRKNWRWGIVGFHFALIALAYHFIFAFGFGPYYFINPTNGPPETLDTEENFVLTLRLEYIVTDDRYMILKPETTLGKLDLSDDIQINNWKKFLYSSFQEQGYDISKLVDKFFKLNKSHELLTIKSSPPDGYYIDYDGKFERNGMYYRNILYPKAGGHLEISLPAYDIETGYVLIYEGFQSESYFGGGGFHLLKLNGYLGFDELAYVGQWVS